MIFAIVMMQASVAEHSLGPVQSAEPVASVSGGNRFYPGELRAPVNKYASCVIERSNAAMAAMGGVSRGDEVRRIFAQVRIDCRVVRLSAAADGIAILNRLRAGRKADRARIVEAALSTVESHETDFAAMVEASNSPDAIAARKGAGNAPNQ
jgi:hypothetical protein